MLSDKSPWIPIKLSSKTRSYTLKTGKEEPCYMLTTTKSNWILEIYILKVGRFFFFFILTSSMDETWESKFDVYQEFELLRFDLPEKG